MKLDSNTSYIVALSNPVEGKEDEYNTWYTDTHLVEVVGVEGINSAQRFKLSPEQLREDLPYQYLALYELEAGKESEALENFLEARSGFDMRPVIDLENASVMIFKPITGVVSG